MLQRDTMYWKKRTFPISNGLTKIEKVLYFIYKENYKKLEIEGKTGWQSVF